MLLKLKSYFPFLLLPLAVLSLFWPALLNPFLILYPTFSPLSDIMVIHWPKAHLMAQSWRMGDGLPYWTPLILSGMPLAANQLAMLFYPPAWLLLFLPLEPTFNLLFIFHLLLGGVGLYLLLRRGYGSSQAAALFGGLAFALNGKWLAHAVGGHVSLVGAIGWMPWTLFGLTMLLHPPTPPPPHPPTSPFPHSRLIWATFTALTLAMQIITHTLPVIYSIYLIGAMVGWHLILTAQAGQSQDAHDLSLGQGMSRKSSILLAELKRLWLPLLLIPLLAGLLSAGQVLALLELAPLSNRSLSLEQAAEFSLSPVQLFIGLLLPSAGGGHEYVIYLGLIPLLLLPFGLSRRNGWSWFYGGLFILTLLFALGPATPIHSLFYHFAPGFGWVRTPARLLFVGAIAAAVLAGFGLDHLVANRWSGRSQIWLTRFGAAAAFLALLLGLGLAFGFGQVGRSTLALAIFIPLGLLLILFKIRQIISARLAVSLLLLLLYLDLVSFDGSLMRFVSLAEALAPGQPQAAYLAAKPPLFRAYSPSYSLPMQTAAAYHLSLADGVEPVHLSAYDRFMARAGGYNQTGFSVTIPHFGDGPLETALREATPNLQLLGLLNVKYLVAAFPVELPGLRFDAGIDGVYIYENRLALPRARVVHQTLLAGPDWLAQLESLPDLANVVLVETGPQLTGGTLPASPAWVNYYSPDLIEIETEIAEPGWLVVSEIWYPGWQATVNGQPQPVEKVNGMFRGLYLDQPGRYEIILEYRPWSVVWGNRLAGLTVALITLVAFTWLGLQLGRGS
jgi:hypothetical protein